MAEAAPYLFDRMFEVSNTGADISEATAAEKMREEWERKMADACIKSFEEGQAAGETETLQRIEAETLEQVKLVVSSAQKMLSAVERECDQIHRDSIQIASMAAELLAGELLARHPTINAEALFSEALEHARNAPHIAISVNDAHAGKVQDVVTVAAIEQGFAGKVVVLGDPETETGDCALQWADGGISINTEKIRSEIRKVVRAHLDRLPGGHDNAQSTQTKVQDDQSNVTASEPGAGSGERS